MANRGIPGMPLTLHGVAAAGAGLLKRIAPCSIPRGIPFIPQDPQLAPVPAGRESRMLHRPLNWILGPYVGVDLDWATTMLNPVAGIGECLRTNKSGTFVT
jgi:hypothetical protein